MIRFARRRTANFCWTVGLGGMLTWLTLLYGLSLRDTSFLTGWLLFAGIVFLLAYNLRKKLPFLPLLPSSVWLQAHVHCGWLVALLFLLHTGFRLPTGVLETALWWLAQLVLATGVIGVILTRLLPEKILHHGERIIFERLRGFRAELGREVEELASQSLSTTPSSTISTFYVDTLQPYLSSPQNLWSHICQSSAPKIKMEQEFRIRERYLNDEGKLLLSQIESRIQAAENIDYQYAMQLVLKGWLFVHIPLSYALILVVLCHVVLVYAFAGSGR